MASTTWVSMLQKGEKGDRGDEGKQGDKGTGGRWVQKVVIDTGGRDLSITWGPYYNCAEYVAVLESIWHGETVEGWADILSCSQDARVV
jgi:hypothetical protein